MKGLLAKRAKWLNELYGNKLSLLIAAWNTRPVSLKESDIVLVISDQHPVNIHPREPIVLVTNGTIWGWVRKYCLEVVSQ
jgi:hypothetical protein